MALTVPFKDTARPNGAIETRILDNRPIAQNQWSIWLKAESDLPDFQPGNFCMLSLPDFVDPLTPRPFAIVEKKNGAYNFIYKTIGKFTKLLTKIPNGARVSMIGPLGKGFSDEFLKSHRVVCLSGGVGYASLLPVIDRMNELKVASPSIFYGVRTELEIIRRGPGTILFCSDDGSIGLNGKITDLVKKNQDVLRGVDVYLICGPTAMMKALYDLLPAHQSYYFLEETMGCGVGICIGCVVPIKRPSGETSRVRSCLEGPIFIGDQLKPWKDGEWQA